MFNFKTLLFAALSQNLYMTHALPTLSSATQTTSAQLENPTQQETSPAISIGLLLLAATGAGLYFAAALRGLWHINIEAGETGSFSDRPTESSTESLTESSSIGSSTQQSSHSPSPPPFTDSQISTGSIPRI